MRLPPFDASRPRSWSWMALLLGLAVALGGCSDDDDDPMGPGSAERTFTVTLTNVSPRFEHFASGVFDTPEGASEPGPIGPEQMYEVRFGAARGDRLTFAAMMVQSNDLFYGTPVDGIDLYPDGVALSGEITDQIVLWDAGTEFNQEPGVGEDQAPRQVAPGTGADDVDPAVRPVDDVYTYPAVNEVLSVRVFAEGEGEFTLRLENVSDANTLQPSVGPSLPVPVSPGVYLVHQDPEPIFDPGLAEPGEGLESLAEDGDPAALAATLAARSGVEAVFSPGVFAVHDTGRPLFSRDGNIPVALEPLAEDGDPALLFEYAAELATVGHAGVFSTPLGQSNPGPLVPGASYRLAFAASPGDRLSFATMLVESNDLFYAFDPVGQELFTDDGSPRTGNLGDAVTLWDAGTEVNQWPGAGPDQGARQPVPGAGDPDPDTDLRPVDDGYAYPQTSEVIEIVVEVD